MSERYKYDFGACSIKKGWAQVDTEQDASYYGTWANPSKLQIFTFIEGDLELREAESEQEFVAELRSFVEWCGTTGYAFKGIDPGLGEVIAGQFRALGLGDLLH
jgi:hypothetical protein